MNRKESTLVKLGIYTIGIFSLAYVYSIIINKNMCPTFFYISIDQVEIRNLINTIWQVQAAVSLLSITLVSIIIGKLDSKIYGQSMSDILLINNKCKLGYWGKVILSLILVIGNLFFVSNGKLSSSIFIFIVNGLIIIVIYKETYEVIIRSKVYKLKVSSYIKEVLRQKIEIENTLKESVTSNEEQIEDNIYTLINNLYAHSIELIDENNVRELNKNLLFFLECMKICCDNSKKTYSEIEKNMQEKLIKIISIMIEKGKITEVKRVIKELLYKKEIYGNTKYIFESILNQLVDSVLNFKSKQQFLDYKIEKFIVDILTEKDNIKNLDKQYISFLIYRYYSNILNNNYIFNKVKNELNDNFIDWITSITYLGEESDEYVIHKYAIYYMSKDMININDFLNFGKLVSKIFINNRLGLHMYKTDKIYEIMSTQVVYLYYVCFGEKYFKGEYRKRIKNLINASIENRTNDAANLKKLTQRSKGVFFAYYNKLKKEMNEFGWEYIPLNRVKSMILDGIINEFYIFYGMAFFNKDLLYNLNDIELKNIQALLEFFKSDGSLKEKSREKYNEFCTWLDIDNINYTNIEFYEYLNKVYKELILEQVKSCREMKEEVYKGENDIIFKINESLKNSIFYCENLNEKSCREYKVDLPLDIEVLSGEVYLLGDPIEDQVLMKYENVIIDEIIKDSESFNFNFKDTQKIDKLFYKINNLSGGVKINAILNTKLHEEKLITYYEDENKINELIRYENSLEFLGKASMGMPTIYLDKNKVDAKIKILKIDIRDLKQEEVEKQVALLNKKNEKFIINSVNEIEVYVNKHEAETYIMKRFKLLEVSCGIYLKTIKPCSLVIGRKFER